MGTRGIYWELEMSVHLCGDFGFENKGYIVVIGMDVPVWSAWYRLPIKERTSQTQLETQ